MNEKIINIDEFEALNNALQREREARKQAEKMIEEKSRELFHVNQELKLINRDLDLKVRERGRELEEMNHELSKALKARDSFLRSIGHELYTPLNIIQGNINLFDTENEDNIRILDRINIQINQLYNIIKVIIKIAEIESGKMNTEQVFSNLVEMLHEHISLNRASINRNRNILNVSDSITHLKFYVDRTILNFVFQQLISYVSNYFYETKTCIDWDIIKDNNEKASLKMIIKIETEEKIEINEGELEEKILYLDPTNTNKDVYLQIILGTSKKLLELVHSNIETKFRSGELIIIISSESLRYKDLRVVIEEEIDLSDSQKADIIKRIEAISNSMTYNDYVSCSEFLYNFNSSYIRSIKIELDDLLEDFNLKDASTLLNKTIEKLNV